MVSDNGHYKKHTRNIAALIWFLRGGGGVWVFAVLPTILVNVSTKRQQKTYFLSFSFSRCMLFVFYVSDPIYNTGVGVSNPHSQQDKLRVRTTLELGSKSKLNIFIRLWKWISFISYHDIEYIVIGRAVGFYYLYSGSNE